MARPSGSWAVVRRLLEGWRPRRRRGPAPVRRVRTWQGSAPFEPLEGRAMLSAAAGDYRFFGAITAPGQIDTHTLTTTTTSRLWFDATTSDRDLSWSVSGPQGVLASRTFAEGDARLSAPDAIPSATPGLIPAGTYSVTVSGVGAATGGYSFRILDFSTATSLSLGTATTATLAPANSTQLYAFAGTAGQVVSIDTTAFSTTDTNVGGRLATWSLFDRDGTQVGVTWRGASNSGRLTLPTTGTYTLVLEGDAFARGTTTATFSVRDVIDMTAALTLGTPVRDTIGILGEARTYTFTLAAPTRLWFDALATSYYGASWELTGPQGVVTPRQPFSDGDVTLGLLPAGSYTLAVSGTTNEAFAFSLLDVAAATSLSIGTSTTATLAPANSTQLFSFAGTAGQVVYLDNTAFATTDTNASWYGYTAVWRLLDQEGTRVGNAWSFDRDSGRLTIPTTGVYTLALEGATFAKGTTTATFTVRDVVDTTAALALGTPVTGTIGSLEETRNYTFTLASAMRLWFDSQATSYGVSWNLTGPQGAVTAGQPFAYGDTSLGLLPAGSYTLAVSGTANEAFAFSLLDVAAATSLSIGTSTTATLAPANSTQFFSFAGTAGQVVYLDSTAFATTGENGPWYWDPTAFWRVFDQDGTQVGETWSLDRDSGRLTLPTTGVYTLALEGTVFANGTTTATFTVRDVVDTTAALALGTPVTGTIGSFEEAKNYTFTLASPTRLWFDSQATAHGVSWNLTGPQGTVTAGRPFWYGDQRLGLLPAGSYTLAVSGSADTAFAFNVLDVAAATSLSIGTSTTATLAPANSTQLFSFAGTAGQVIYLDNTAFATTGKDGSSYWDPPAVWRVLDQDGTQVGGTWYLDRDSGRLTLPATGAYTLALEGKDFASGTTTATFSVRDVIDITAALTLGTAVTDTLGIVAEARNYTFTLASAMRLWFDSQATSYGVSWNLTGPQGAVTAGRLFAYGDTSLGLLPAGAYTLTVSGSAGAAFAFNVLDLAAATNLSIGTSTTATLAPANSTQLFSFAGTAGQVVFIDTTAFSTTNTSGPSWQRSVPSWRVLDQDGNQVGIAWRGDGGSGRLTLPTTGGYTLVLEGDVSAIGTTTATVTVWDVIDTTAAVALGTAVTDTIGNLEEARNYTFTLAAPTRLWFDSLAATYGASWKLNGPQGTVTAGQPFVYVDTRLGLLPAGPYTLAVSGAKNTVFAFNLLDLATTTGLSIGTSTTATLAPANSTQLFSFAGTAGQVVSLDTTTFATTDETISGELAQWRLFDPDGTQVGGTWSLDRDSGRLTLPTTGVYTLALEGTVFANGTTTATFTVRDVVDTTAALALGTPVTGTIGSFSEAKNYTFTLASPTRLWFDSQAASYGVSWKLTGPQGAVTAGQPFAYGDTSLGLLPEGSYTLTVSGTADTAFAFNVLDVAAATSLSIGTATTATLAPANSTQVFSFAGTAGQVVYLDNTEFATTTTNGSWYWDPPACWSVFDQDGTQVGGVWRFDRDSGRLTLPTTGVYTFVLAGSVYANGTTTATFTVRDVIDTTAALALGTPVTGTIGSPGEARNYTFTLAAPTRLWFDSQTTSYDVSWKLTGSQGAVTWGQPFEYGDQSLGLLPAGSYTLAVSGTTNEAFAFSLLDVAAATSLSIGTSTTATLAPANSTQLFSFAGTAGQVVYLDNTAFATTDTNAWCYGYTAVWRLLDQEGTQVGNAWSFDRDSGRLALPTTGTYTLVYEGYISATGTTTTTFTVWPGVDTTATLALGTRVTGRVGGLDGARSYTFTLAAPARLWLDSQVAWHWASWELTGPQGVVTPRRPFPDGDANLGLLPAGSYTLTVRGDAYTPFAFSVLDLATATSLALGTSTTATLAPANATQCYSFTGTAGQGVYVAAAAVSTTDPNSSWYWWLPPLVTGSLFDQEGHQVGATWDLAGDSGRLTLPTTGTYTLVLTGSLSASGTTTATFTARSVVDDVRQLWGTAGDDAIVIRALSASSADVFLNGYLMGTVTAGTPLTIVGRGGVDAVTVVGTEAADTFSITPTSIRINALPLTLSGIATVTVDGGAGADRFDVSGANPGVSLRGGAGADTFALADAASVGSLDGGADGGTLDLSAFTTGVVLDVAGGVVTGVNAVAGITAVVGSPRSDAPIGTSRTVTARDDAAYTFAVADFAFTDPGDTPANGLAAVRIVTPPHAGVLTNGGAAITAGATVTAADIAAGKLVYRPLMNGIGRVAFTFHVQDDGGTASGGIDLDPTPRTMTVAVEKGNSAPTDILLSAATVAENRPSGTAVGTLTTADRDADDTFTYALVPGPGAADNGWFAIRGNVLETSAAFDFETRSSFTVRVRATDRGGLFTEKAFTIGVLDVVEVPGLPAGLVATPGNGQVGLSWNRPVSDGGAAITDYAIEYRRGGTATWTRFNDGVSAATSTVVTGLANGVSYVFRVAAVNVAGPGAFSTTAVAVAPKPVPGAPTAVTGVAGDGRVTLSWTTPAVRGSSAISDYRLQYSADRGTSWTTFGDAVSAATSATVTGLRNGTSYVFRVAAVNAVGTGLSSAASAVITPRTLPGLPTAVAAVAGNGRVTLTWAAPASSGGAGITDYRVHYSSTGGATWTTFADAVSSATSATVTGLTNGVSYVFRLAAVNAAGTGPFTLKSAAVTPRTVPGVPTGLTATAVAGKVNLAWTAPASNGGAAVTDYVIQYSSTGGTTWTTFADATSSSPKAAVTGLSKGLSYVFRVAAVNAAGRGAFSPKTGAVTVR